MVGVYWGGLRSQLAIVEAHVPPAEQKRWCCADKTGCTWQRARAPHPASPGLSVTRAPCHQRSASPGLSITCLACFTALSS